MNTVHTSAIRHLGRFREVRRSQGVTIEYKQYFSSGLEDIEQRLKEFWEAVDDPDSHSGFVSTSKKLVESMAKCVHCTIAFATKDLGADDDNDEVEIQQVEAVLKPDISDSSKKPTTPQHSQKQRSLKKYVYQAIAECLAVHLAPKPDNFQEDVLKFCVSSSEDWLFGVIDCRDGNSRPCYITDTLTYKFDGETDATKFEDITTLLMTWMCIPAEEILPHMEEHAEPL